LGRIPTVLHNFSHPSFEIVDGEVRVLSLQISAHLFLDRCHRNFAPLAEIAEAHLVEHFSYPRAISATARGLV